MIFRNIILSSIIIGVLTGLVYGLFQHTMVTPIILNAEQYEVVETPVSSTLSTSPTEHDHAGHSHDADAWAPEDGTERTSFTVTANILIGIAFALFLISLMALHNLKSSKPNVNLMSGLGWGVASLIALFLAPALLGLHPEVPGTIAAELQTRQIWWLYCTVATAVGLAVLYYAPTWIKLVGVGLVVLPHITGAPHPAELGFANTDPDAIAALTALSSEFYTMTALGMVIFFLLLGVFSAFATNRFVNLKTV